jgi:hypothetical protein
LIGTERNLIGTERTTSRPSRNKVAPFATGDQSLEDSAINASFIAQKEERPKGFKGLAQILEEAIHKRFQEAKMRDFAKITDVNPVFTWSQFLRGFIYHFLFFFVLGPLVILIMLPFESVAYIKNICFLPNKPLFAFFVIQYVTVVTFAAIVYYVYTDSTIREETPDIALPLAPFYLIIINLVLRNAIISTRHGTTPPVSYNRLRKNKIDTQNVNETLILFAWVQVTPMNLMPEIDKSMARLGI